MYQNKIFCGQFNLNEKTLYGILEIRNNNISLELHDFKRELKLNEGTVEAIQGTIVEKIHGYEHDGQFPVHSEVYLKNLIHFKSNQGYAGGQVLFHVGECFFTNITEQKTDIIEELKFDKCFFRIETSHNRILSLVQNDSVDCFFSEEEGKESRIFTFGKQEFKLEIDPNSIAPNSKKYHVYCHRKFRPLSKTRLCTATGNLDHSLKQDCDTITISLKGEFRWRNEENSPLSLKLKSCLKHSVVKVHKQSSVGAITSANNSSRSGSSKLLKMWHLCLLPRISTPARRQSGLLNLSNLLVD